MKVAGTVACVSGAILMVVFKGPAMFGFREEFGTHGEISAKGRPEPVGWFVAKFMEFGLVSFHLGVLCLIGNCMCMATYLAIQGAVLKRYPASLSVTAYSYFFGAVLTVTVALFMTNDSTGWSLNQSEFLAIIDAVASEGGNGSRSPVSEAAVAVGILVSRDSLRTHWLRNVSSFRSHHRRYRSRSAEGQNQPSLS